MLCYHSLIVIAYDVIKSANIKRLLLHWVKTCLIAWRCFACVR